MGTLSTFRGLWFRGIARLVLLVSATGADILPTLISQPTATTRSLIASITLLRGRRCPRSKSSYLALRPTPTCQPVLLVLQCKLRPLRSSQAKAIRSSQPSSSKTWLPTLQSRLRVTTARSSSWRISYVFTMADSHSTNISAISVCERLQHLTALQDMGFHQALPPVPCHARECYSHRLHRVLGTRER